MRKIIIIFMILISGCETTDGKLGGYSEAQILDINMWNRSEYWVPTKRAAPKEPREMYSKNIEGCVNVSSVIGVDGKTYEIKIVKSVPPGFFDQNSIAAVKRFKYKPSESNSERKPVRSNDIFAFTINGSPKEWTSKCDNV